MDRATHSWGTLLPRIEVYPTLPFQLPSPLKLTPQKNPVLMAPTQAMGSSEAKEAIRLPGNQQGALGEGTGRQPAPPLGLPLCHVELASGLPPRNLSGQPGLGLYILSR